MVGRGEAPWPGGQVVLTKADVSLRWTVSPCFCKGRDLVGDLNMVGNITENLEKSSFTLLGIWVHDLTSSSPTPVTSGFESPPPGCAGRRAQVTCPLATERKWSRDWGLSLPDTKHMLLTTALHLCYHGNICSGLYSISY